MQNYGHVGLNKHCIKQLSEPVSFPPPHLRSQCDVCTSMHLQGTDTRGSLRAGDDCVNIKTYSFNASIMSLTVHNVTAVDVR